MWKRIAILTMVAFMVLVAGFFLWVGYEAGRLPFQTDPTRIPVTPFANLPTPPPAATP